jgi:hypothetical protein
MTLGAGVAGGIIAVVLGGLAWLRRRTLHSRRPAGG